MREQDNPLPTIKPGEGPLCRAENSDCTDTPSQGDRVRFVIVRTSAGDNTAKSVRGVPKFAESYQ
jgi:hypothetical protein